MYGSMDGGQAIFTSQEAARHYLACGECEQLMGAHEAYLRLLATGNRAELNARGINVANGGDLTGVDPQVVTRAVFGIILKGHYAEDNLWSPVRLPYRRLDPLRRVVLGGSAFGFNPRIACIKWMAYSRATALREWQYVQPSGTTTRLDALVLLFGGISWFVLFDDELALEMEAEGVPMLQPSGAWTWMVADSTQCQTVDPAILAVHDPQEVDWTTDTANTLACPCGSARSFADCCKGLWYPGDREGYLCDEDQIAEGSRILEGVASNESDHWIGIAQIR